MDEKQVFLILGIEKTKDEEVIKNAYRLKLMSVNPEDNPEGFKKLRMAYEEACRLAVKEETVLEEDTSPIGLWISRISNVYRCLPKRVDPGVWKELLTEDICLALDTQEECRQRLLGFLMDHFRLNTAVWKQLDDVLLISSSREELIEAYPKEYVDFAIHQCEQGDWFPYEHFRGEAEAEYDLFISQFFDLAKRLENGSIDGVEPLLEQADSLDIYHPYLELERARYFSVSGRQKEAGKLVDQVLAEMGDDGRTYYIGAKIKWDIGEKDTAAGFYHKLLAETPNHYMANKMLGQYYQELGDYEKAKEYSIEAVKISSQDSELQDQIKKINLVLIEQYRERLTNDENDMKCRLELGWCYLQNEELIKGIILMNAGKPDESQQMEYHNLLGKLYYSNEQFDKSLEHLLIWSTRLSEHSPEDEKGEKDRQTRLGTAHAMISRIYKFMGKKDAKYLEQALYEVEQAICHDGDELGYQMEKAAVYLEMEQYQECIKICTQLIEREPGYFPAYVTRQECYSNLRDAHGVIQDFYAACNIFAGYGKTYELAAEVYFDYQKLEDLAELFKKADENQVVSNKLDIYRAKLKRIQAENIVEANQAFSYMEQLVKQFKDKGAPLEDLANLYCEICLCQDKMRKNAKALEFINKAIRLMPEHIRYLWIKANLLRDSGDYSNAFLIYWDLNVKMKDNDDLYFYMGECCFCQEQPDQALKYYQRALELNPEHARANSKIADIYTEKLEKYQDVSYLESALSYSSRQLEISPRAYYYIERGLIYMAANVWDKGLADFLEAAKLEPDNAFAYNNAGCIYKYQQQYEKAVEMFRKAASVMEKGETLLPYKNLGETYLLLGDYENAIAAYEENSRIFPKNKEIYKGLAGIYRMRKEYQKALDLLGRLYNDANAGYLELAGDICMEMGDAKNALIHYKRLENLKEEPESVRKVLGKRGEIYFYGFKNYIMAKRYLTFSYRALSEGTAARAEACYRLSLFYSLTGMRIISKKYAKMGLTTLEKAFGSIEKYVNCLYQKPWRLYLAARLYQLAKDTERSQVLLDQMTEAGRCRTCTNSECIHLLIGEAAQYELTGDREKALELYGKADEKNPNLMLCRYKIKRLKQ